MAIEFDLTAVVNNLTESMQKRHLRFAFASRSEDSVKQSHQFVLCRDYLSDVVVENNLGGGIIKYPVYGFDAPNLKLDGDKTRLLISYNKIELIKERLKLLADFEERQGWAPTAVTDVDGTTIMVEADKRWQSHSIYISLYTLFIRSLAYVEGESFDNFELLIEAVRKEEGGLESNYLQDLKDSKVKPTILMGIQESMPQSQTGDLKWTDKEVIRRLCGASLHNSLGIRSFAYLTIDLRKKKKRADGGQIGEAWALHYLIRGEGE